MSTLYLLCQAQHDLKFGSSVGRILRREKVVGWLAGWRCEHLRWEMRFEIPKRISEIDESLTTPYVMPRLHWNTLYKLIQLQ